MLPGKGFWRSMAERAQRRTYLRLALSAAERLRGHWALFGAVVEKAALPGQDAIEYAFEAIVIRFDNFLKREHRRGNTHRGLIILDKSTRETRLQSLAREMKKQGHRWGALANRADVPMFVDSSATRAVEYVALVSYALWQRFEKGDAEFLNAISGRFDREGAVVHGLVHRTLDTTCDCDCCDMNRPRTR